MELRPIAPNQHTPCVSLLHEKQLLRKNNKCLRVVRTLAFLWIRLDPPRGTSSDRSFPTCRTQSCQRDYIQTCGLKKRGGEEKKKKTTMKTHTPVYILWPASHGAKAKPSKDEVPLSTSSVGSQMRYRASLHKIVSFSHT